MENTQAPVAGLAAVLCHWTNDGASGPGLHLLLHRRPLGLLPPGQTALWLYGAVQKEEQRSGALSICARSFFFFMVLYKKKNNDLAPIDNALDRLLLMFAFNYPFVAFIAHDPNAMARVPSILRGGVSGFAILLLIGTIVMGVAWLGRQIQRALSGQPLNGPKLMLLAAAIPMHWIALLTPMPNKPIALVAILTIYHNLQYQRLIWFHNQKYTDRGVLPVSQTREARATYGPAAFISRRLAYYLAFGIVFGVIYQGPRQYLGYLNLHTGDSSAALSVPIQLGIAFLWGYAFIHYYLDSQIWRVRRDPSVGQALNMN